ncbi:MAG: sodium/proline symporter PutP [Lachnospiraceae bacterium]|nr:sodium/proline symporter PutP [Lachnospiraceae bacterium]
MNSLEMLAFVLYLLIVITIGVYFYFKGRRGDGGDKMYFLGGRQMNGWVAALSAGASDMSAWVLMGLPGSIYAYGMGQIWISIGLFIGTLCAWIFVAPGLRRFSMIADDSITIPQYLTRRFKSQSKTLQIISAVIFIVAYCVYAASSIVACGNLFNTVFGIDTKAAMIGATVIILVYTFFGGFNAVCWTDFIQGMLMLLALMTVPIVVVIIMGQADFTPLAKVVTDENYYNVLSSGKFDWKSISDILSGFGWGLGYMGMPHILVRFMSIRSEKEMKKSRIIGTCWTAVILIMASVVALAAHEYLGTYLDVADRSLVFIVIVRKIFPAFIAGVLLSAILAASMSTADSQLLASSSAFASDVYKPVFRKKATNSEMLWAGRIVVMIISVIALMIAMSDRCAGIMALVECAWAAFGAAFGPTILLSLHWKRLTYTGAVAGIVTGFVVDALWYVFLSGRTNLYEIIPGFICSLIAAVVVSKLDKEPSAEIMEMFERAKLPVEK